MTHTAEPWKVWGRTVNGQKGLLIEDQYGESIALVHEGGADDEADARRIVACVNACKGIPTDVLEHAADFGSAGIQAIESVRKHRDELLALVEKVIESKCNLGAGWSLQADDAIAAIKGHNAGIHRAAEGRPVE